MPYQSIDSIQKTLSETVFSYTADKKKAAGRALGTLVEVIIFYLLKTWDLGRYIAIERPLPEYGNKAITHNVEYSLHPSKLITKLDVSRDDVPLTARKIVSAISSSVDIDSQSIRNYQLLSSTSILRNSCTIADMRDSFLIATIEVDTKTTVSIHQLYNSPFAMVECKRVGVEEGTRKGPQTIEKAKQGAYVARTVSSLQKIRLINGEIGGIIQKPDGSIVWKKYAEFLDEVINSNDKDLLKDFILTVGVVSNHGNWFTSNEHNKELKVLSQSYDWLIFLTDEGLCEFINELIMKPEKEYMPIRQAFLSSYSGHKVKNQFTKVQMNLQSDILLQRYFKLNIDKIHNWFNVIGPKGKKLEALCSELRSLAGKNWEVILK